MKRVDLDIKNQIVITKNISMKKIIFGVLIAMAIVNITKNMKLMST